MTYGMLAAQSCLLTDIVDQFSMKQLEKVLYIAQSTTAGIISRLEQKRLVEGYTDAEDKRIKMVHITQSGIDRVLETKRDMTRAEEILLSGLPVSCCPSCWLRSCMCTQSGEWNQ